jgi:large subunit ribosomal protein L17
MFRNMVTSLFKYDRIRTTDAKAKELRSWADHIVTLAKRGDLHARRQAMSIVREKDVVHKLFENAAERFGSVSGGYTRVVKLGRRPGDAARVSLVELITDESREQPKSKKMATPVVPVVKEKPEVKEDEKSVDTVAAAEAKPEAEDQPVEDAVEAASEESAKAATNDEITEVASADSGDADDGMASDEAEAQAGEEPQELVQPGPEDKKEG